DPRPLCGRRGDRDLLPQVPGRHVRPAGGDVRPAGRRPRGSIGRSMNAVEVIDVASRPWGPSMVPQRGGKMAHKRLFDGVEGSPDNYSFVLADESNEYVSPRHRHPWDQIRVCLAGAIPIGRTATVEAGEIAYFPEGVSYGPQQGGVDRLVLLLQFGGASHLGFLSFEQVSAARDELARSGSF